MPTRMSSPSWIAYPTMVTTRPANSRIPNERQNRPFTSRQDRFSAPPTPPTRWGMYSPEVSARWPSISTTVPAIESRTPTRIATGAPASTSSMATAPAPAGDAMPTPNAAPNVMPNQPANSATRTRPWTAPTPSSGSRLSRTSRSSSLAPTRARSWLRTAAIAMIPLSTVPAVYSTKRPPYMISSPAGSSSAAASVPSRPSTPPGTASWASPSCASVTSRPPSTGRPSITALFSEMVRAALSSRSTGSHGRSNGSVPPAVTPAVALAVTLTPSRLRPGSAPCGDPLHHPPSVDISATRGGPIITGRGAR